MERRDNYRLQAQQAKQRFLSYDQKQLIEKFHLPWDEEYLYVHFLGEPYRICRTTGDMAFQRQGRWLDGNSYEEVMTLLDLLCDSSPDRHPAYDWKSMEAFGGHVHRRLLEEEDPWAKRFGEDLPGFCQACRSLGGQPLPQGDGAFALEVFDGLLVAVQLWLGDQEFPSRLRILWDANALQYLKYETMYFAKALILEKIMEKMEERTPG